MSSRFLGVGLALHPEAETIELLGRAIEELADFYELSPEMHWQGEAEPAPTRALLADLVRRSGKPVVAHGLFLSLGSSDDPERLGAALARIERDQAEFDFLHYSDHLGFCAEGGRESALPLPLPWSEASAQVVAARLRCLRDVVPAVAFENSALLVQLGDPLLEPDFLARVCELGQCGLVLDLHNAYANCLNAGVELEAWLARVPWEQVVELHLSGGSWSEEEWGAERRRLDTHDGPVPEDVWRAAELALARSPRLRGVVLERIGLVASEVSGFEDELRRARELVARRPAPLAPAPPERAPLPAGPAPAETSPLLLDALLSQDPGETLAAGVGSLSPPAQAVLGDLDPSGLTLTHLIVHRLRCERILAGDGALRQAFQRDPGGFSARYRGYSVANPPQSVWPREEARRFRAHWGT